MDSPEKFGPEYRIKNRKDFLRIQSRGRKVRSSHFLLIYQKTSPEQAPRIGITVTKKIDKRAVGRNKIKRRVRDYFRKRKQHFCSSADLVVIALNGAQDLDYREICWQLEGLFRRAKVVRGPNGRDRGEKPGAKSE